MKDLLLEKPVIKLNDDDKINSFLTYSKLENGVVIKIGNNLYKHKIDDDGTCWLSILIPFYEFDDMDELTNILETMNKPKTKPKSKSKKQ